MSVFIGYPSRANSLDIAAHGCGCRTDLAKQSGFLLHGLFPCCMVDNNADYIFLLV